MITIISGLPGKGKTSLLVKQALVQMLDYGTEDWLNCKLEVRKLVAGGFNNLLLPPMKHCVYADFPISYSRKLKSYYIDGFQIGLPNPFFQTMFIPPYSTIFLDEAQKYYDSRMSKYLREEVYRWYQLHRHNHYNVVMCCQRLANIDVNIRAIADRFLVVEDIEVKEDKYGCAESIKWKMREFTSCDTAENYQLSKDRKELCDLGKVIEDTTDLPVFDCYDSHGCKPVFYHMNMNRPFDYYTENGYQFSLESFVEFNNSHYFVAPRGYFKNTKYDEEVIKKMEVLNAI